MNERSQLIRQYIKALPLLAALFLCLCPEALAEEPLIGTLPTLDPRPIGMGRAMRAAPAGTSSIYLNPSLISMVPQYHGEGMYQYTGPENAHMGGAVIVDSVTTVVGAGVGFNYVGIRQPRTKHDSYDIRLALSGAIGGKFFLGATGRYLFLEQNRSSEKWGPAGTPALPASGHQQVDGFTFDVGTALKLGEIVRLGLAGYNLTNTGSVFAPIELGTGISFSIAEMLIIEVDAAIDFTSHDKVGVELNLGAELFLMNALAIRGGYIYDVYYNIHAPCAGLGYVHSRFGLDLGFMKEAREEGRMVVAFGFKVFVN